MEPLDGSADVVHPEVRAHISSLVSALGGVDPDDDEQYQLGDDALEVLRDIKRWIRFYDEKTNRMDVARCIFEAKLIEGDILPILRTWRENSMDNKFKSRIALACFEVMVPLTWPMERDKEQMTVNHHRHIPVLELAQVYYKRAIINFDGARILHSAVRVALPAIATPISDRTARDQGIIKLVLFFLRNMAQVTTSPNVKYEGDESQVSRSATIDAFAYQDIFMFLLTVASNMGEDFRTEDTAVMEIIFHLVKRVDNEKLFLNEKQLNTAKANELSHMMNKESSMLLAHNRKGPTRHNRFGTMIWVKRDDGKMSALSGQDALADASLRNELMDGSKVYKPPRRARKEDKNQHDLGRPVALNARANDQLRSFVEEFLDSAFNPLFLHIRKTMDRDASHVLLHHRRQYFYLVAWFLQAERLRRQAKKTTSRGKTDEVGSFNLVAGVLNQEMFITLTRALHESYENKEWHELEAVMRCFTQILLTIQEMTECGNEDDEEIAENVLSRLFYEEATHDAVANIVRTYKNQGFEYLDAATELVHHFLRILEAYSKQNVDMQVKSRKRTRQKKKETAKSLDDGAIDESDGSGNDEAQADRTAKERKFDFHRFTSRFTPQGVVDTFITFTKYYQDLNDAQLKRAHRYLYRVAFKQEMSVMLFRVDTIHLLYNMVNGPSSLDKSSSMFKDWEELVKQILRKCFKKIEQRPELIIEMLFSKLRGIAFFLEYGYEKQTSASKTNSKPGPELEFKIAEEKDKQIAIVVGALLDKNQGDHITWIKSILAEAENERRSWEAAEEAKKSVEIPFEDNVDAEHPPEPKTPPIFSVQPDNPERRTAMFKNSHLRLLMTLCEVRSAVPATEETNESPWLIPADVSADSLKDALHFINQAEFNPPTFEDGGLAENQLKRKSAPKKKAVFDDDEDDDMDDELLFPMGGPTARKPDDEGGVKKKRKRLLKRNQAEVDDSVLDERARKRREREREKALKIKSAMYVNEGDDDFDSEEDEAFFARERTIAARAADAAKLAVDRSDQIVMPKKRKSAIMLEDSDDDGDGLSVTGLMRSSPEERDGSETDDTPPSVSDGEGRKKRRMRINDSGMDDANTDADAEAEGQPSAKSSANENAPDGEDEPMVVTRRPRARGGFLMDSDDE